MNPPSALYGAMSKERKPFTYTPGGLDLSEIKSERMAKRLMRNAMSQGVSDTPVQTVQSPPIVPGTIPNFNCLPVQVFPTFQLPANPKTLLRTRSNSDAPKEPTSNNLPPASTYIVNKPSSDSWREINKPSSEYADNNIISNYMPTSLYDYKSLSDNSRTIQPNYGSYDHTDPILPEKSYDAQYFRLQPQETTKEIGNKNIIKENIQPRESSDVQDVTLKNSIDNEMNPVHVKSPTAQDIASNNYEQKEVKIVKKQKKVENESNQNGDAEAAITVKLPTKSSAAKTETKVEVLKKTLPDGTIEEVTKTITKTTVDGKTEISTKTETRIIPKEIVENEVEVEEEEEEEEIENVVVEKTEEDSVKETNKDIENKVLESIENGDEVSEQNDEEIVSDTKETEVKENGHILTGDEKSETSTTKKVVVIQSTGEESEEEIEEEIEEEVEEEEEEGGDVQVEEVVIIKKPSNKDDEVIQDVTEDNTKTSNEVEQEQEIEQEQEQEIEKEQEQQIQQEQEVEAGEEQKENDKPVIQEEAENENEEESDVKADSNVESVDQKENESLAVEDNLSKEECNEDGNEEYEEAEDVETKNEEREKKLSTPVDETKQIEIILETKEENKSKDDSVIAQECVAASTTESEEKQEITKEILHKTTIDSEPKVLLREPSIPLEKVEDIEIKPIGPAQEIIKKCHTEIITTTTDKPSGALSTQTEYNRIENVVTVNRTTKTLDHGYDTQQQPIPTLKTYFSPINDRILSTPQPVSRPYQPVYTPEPQTERRHSLLLERLSVDRQIPATDVYQNNYQSNQVYEQNQWLDEPQSEVLTVSNVKPSTITKNQQWYQQTKKDSFTSNSITSTPVLPSQIWNQQNQGQPQNQMPTQPQYQTFTQQPYIPKPEYQSTFIENNAQNIYKTNTANLQQNMYPSYTPKPSWVSSTFDSKPASNIPSNQYSSLNKESTESYQKSTQQFNSSYVPPPWEQDSSFVTDNQCYYQPPPTVSYTPTTNQTWTPNPPPNKFSKPKPTSYIPPAPNQSFVKPVSADDTTKLSGRKTYYSEYERRYISVPESTYVPNESKFQVQPDPSPQYYYDNNEPPELVEPQWRKELREFTEKTSQTTTQNENTSVRPPWEEDPKYAASTEYTATVTPSWTQTLRPQTWRERSYEPEYNGSKAWPKTNTLGRGRPQSSYVKSNINTIPERPRGVSVDRYNPNNYQSPLTSEHPPVQSHTLDPTIHPRTYHNPQVPAYHARASAEPREQVTAYPQQRMRADKIPPVQSRSFKYLQWITGTED